MICSLVTKLLVKILMFTTTVTVNLPATLARSCYETANNSSPTSLEINLVNTLRSLEVQAIVTGRDVDGRLVMLSHDGTLATPTIAPFASQLVDPRFVIHLGVSNSVTTVQIPAVYSGRIWIGHRGPNLSLAGTLTGTELIEPTVETSDDPNAHINWSFFEFNFDGRNLVADSTCVDFVGLPYGFTMTDHDGSVQSISAAPANATEILCGKLQAQALLDKSSWNDLCVYDVTGALVRVLSPSKLLVSNPSAFHRYYSDYISRCWDRLTHETLTIYTPAAQEGSVNCTVREGLLDCDNDNRGYAMPSAADIFSCSGPFDLIPSDNSLHRAIVPIICAGLNRATLCMESRDRSTRPPVAAYHNAGPANYYAKFVHEMYPDGVYAFPYDDVSVPGSLSQSSLSFSSKAKSLTLSIGGL